MVLKFLFLKLLKLLKLLSRTFGDIDIQKKKIFFSLSISPKVIISLPTFIFDNKFLCFIMFGFLRSNRYFALSL